MLNGAPVFARSRLQHSIAVDITDSESFAYSVAGIMAEVIRGLLEDTGLLLQGLLPDLLPEMQDLHPHLRMESLSDTAIADRC